MAIRSAAPLVALLVLGACVPKVDAPASEVPKLGSLEKVMDAQATTADPQMKKAGASSYSDDDYAAFLETASRIQATSTKAKEWTKGPEFDAFADRLHETAVSLEAAAKAKDAKASSEALTAMKATCKACHSKFK